MGITQHTCGAQNIKTFAHIQTLMGNMGRAGGGINALRGIHNVQGSTDMGLLYGNIPAYSGNPTHAGRRWHRLARHAERNNAFGKYMDALWGTPLSGTATRTTDERLVRRRVQHRRHGAAAAWVPQHDAEVVWRLHAGHQRRHPRTRQACCGRCRYSLWPKGNGDDHITMFRKMGSRRPPRPLVCLGPEPRGHRAEPGRDPRRSLEPRPAGRASTCSRPRPRLSPARPAGVTYLIPTAAHVEKAGSATNSGRTLQWRYKAADPAGNSKDDTELLLRFAKALDDANGCFSHIHRPCGTPTASTRATPASTSGSTASPCWWRSCWTSEHAATYVSDHRLRHRRHGHLRGTTVTRHRHAPTAPGCYRVTAPSGWPRGSTAR